MVTRRLRAAALAIGLAVALAACSASAAGTAPQPGGGDSAAPRSTSKPGTSARATPDAKPSYGPESPAPNATSFDPSLFPDPKKNPLPLYEAPVVGRTVYLTFDDGPDRTWTPKVLDVLAEYDAKATFFVLGKQVRFTPQLVADEAAAGMSVQSHSNTHPDLRTVDDKLMAFKQLRPVTNLITKYAGTRPTCLRPPYGAYDDRVQAIAGGLKLRLALWTDDSLDWSKPGVTAITAQVLKYVRPGAVLLFHDGGGDRSQTVAALRIVLADLVSQGYTFGTLCQE